MDMATALAELGVTECTVDAATKEQLDRDGYAPLPGVLDGRAGEKDASPPGRADGGRGRPRRARGTPGGRDRPGAWPISSTRTRFRGLLHPSGSAGLRRPRARRLCAVLAQQPCCPPGPGPPGTARRGGTGGPRSLPGVQLDLAAGRFHRGQRRDTVWVPGSHRRTVSVRDTMPDPAAAHPGEVKLTASACTVVAFTTLAVSGPSTARAASAARCTPTSPAAATLSSSTKRKYIRPETLARISPAARFILDV